MKSLEASGKLRNHADKVQAVVASASAACRSGLAASWRRSLLHHHIDPATSHHRERLSAPQIAERREASARMLHVSRSLLDRLAGATDSSGVAVFLSDASGFVVDERIRAADTQIFHSRNLAAGSDWSEGAEGTNGIGTCAIEGRPVTICRDQHFRESNIVLTCSGAPIYGPQAAMAGILDVSSARSDMTDEHAKLVALSVQDTAQRIEVAMFCDFFNQARIVFVTPTPQFAASAVLLALDRDDLVIGATRAARRQMMIAPDDIGSVSAGDLLDATPRRGLDAAAQSEMVRALARNGGNVSAAARELGIGRATFYRRLQSKGA
ncbi:GAF domain-containing protein [Rhodobacteraceae bacterium]|nr:GAF domain-containing protein [Paracoccaceae bacterium]